MKTRPGYQAIAISDVEHENLWRLVPDAELVQRMDVNHSRWEEVRMGRRLLPAPSHFRVETRLLDAELPLHSNGERGPWLSVSEWDFHVYQCARIGRQSRHSAVVWAKENSALRRAGVHKRWRDGINDRLVAAGALETASQAGKEGWAVMAAPCPARDDLVRPAVPRSNQYLEEYDSFFLVPNRIMDDDEWFFWKNLKWHEMRRLTLTIYSFCRYRDYGGVDPNHLRIEQDEAGLYWIVVSDQFLDRARIDLMQLREGLQLLFSWRKPKGKGDHPLITVPRVRLAEDHGYDGTDSRLVYLGDGGAGPYHLIRPRIGVQFDIESMQVREVSQKYDRTPIVSSPALRALALDVDRQPLYWLFRPGPAATRPSVTWSTAPTPDSAAADFAAAVAMSCGKRRTKPFTNVAISASCRPVSGQSTHKLAKNIVDGVVLAGLRSNDRTGIDRVDCQVQQEDEGWSTITVDAGVEVIEASPRTRPYGKQPWLLVEIEGEARHAFDRESYRQQLLDEADELLDQGNAQDPSVLPALASQGIVVHALVGGSRADADNVVGRMLDQLHYVAVRETGSGLHPAGDASMYRLIYRSLPELEGCFLAVYEHGEGDELP